jgi:hypothetical protein
MSTHLNSPKFVSEVQSLVNGTVPSSDNSSIDTGLVVWNKLKTILDESTTGSAVFTNAIVSTYSLVYTTSSAYIGGVLSPNGDINFIPYNGNRGQKINSAGTVSTYSLVYSTVTSAYAGGVLAPNGDVNFIPVNAVVGQKLNSSSVVSTYSLVYTTSGAYSGGVLSTSGETHFIPYNAARGQKISSAGVVSTYSLVYTASGAYIGGVLAPNGDINFIPFNATVGQKISSAGVVSTYSLIYTGPAVSSYTPTAVLLTSGTSYTVPSGATSMKAWAVGAGGNSYYYGSLVAGAGGCAYKTWTVSNGQSVTYTCGVVNIAAGTGGSSTVTFDGATITGNGGGRTGTGGGYSGGDGGANGGSGVLFGGGNVAGQGSAAGAVGGNGTRQSCGRFIATDVSGLLSAVALAGGKATEDCGTIGAFGSGGYNDKFTNKNAGLGGGFATGYANAAAGGGAVVLYFT